MANNKTLSKDRFWHYLDVAKNMPTIKVDESGNADDVVKWLVVQPDIRSYLMLAVAAKPNPLIIHDPVAGTWQGVDYDD